MQLRHIVWASLKRRKGRFAFLLVALALGIGTVIALVALSSAMRADVSDELDRFGANIIVTPSSRSLDLAYDGLAVGGLTVDARTLTLEDARRVRTIPNRRNLNAVAAKLVGTTGVEGKRLLVIGADFAQERRIKGWWEVRGRVPGVAGEVMLGAEAAQVLAKNVDDALILDGEPRRIVGILAATGSMDDQAVFADLRLVQQALGQPEAVSLIEVSALCRGCPIEDIVAQIAAAIPHARVAPVRQAVAARERAVIQFTRFAFAVSLVVLLVGGLVVMTTMMAAVTERTQEIGILRAVGFRRTQVARVVLLEALGINLLGGLVGWAVGMSAARVLGPSLAQLSSPVPVDFRLALLAMALAMVLGAGGGTYPALRAAGMDPSQALRHI